MANAQCVSSFSYNNGAKDTINFQSTSTGTNLMYNWNFGDHSFDSTSSLKKPKHYFTVKCKKYNVCLTIVDPVNSCIDQHCDSVYASVPSMVPNFTYVISGRNVVTTNTSTGTITKNYWNYGDGAKDSSLNGGHTYAPTYMKDSILLTVKNAYGCLSSVKKFLYTGCNDSFTSVITGTSTIDSVTLTPWSNQTISKITWTVNGGSLFNYTTTTNTTTPVVLPLTAAVVYSACVKTTDNHNCISTFCKNIDLSTAVHNVEFANNFSISPNPAFDKVTINFNLLNSSKIDFNLYDVAGRKLFNNSENYISEGLKQFTIDVSKFNNGLYLLEIKNQSSSSVFKKIVVTKN